MNRKGIVLINDYCLYVTPQYLAGVADSDGSFTIYKLHKNRENPHYQTTFSLSWKYSETAEEVMKFLVLKYGGSYCIYLKKSNELGKETNVIKYCLTSKGIEGFLKDVGPYVVLKQKQVQNLLELRKTIHSYSYHRKNKKPQSIIDEQEQLHKYNRSLNDKNKSRSENV